MSCSKIKRGLAGTATTSISSIVSFDKASWTIIRRNGRSYSYKLEGQQPVASFLRKDEEFEEIRMVLINQVYPSQRKISKNRSNRFEGPFRKIQENNTRADFSGDWKYSSVPPRGIPFRIKAENHEKDRFKDEQSSLSRLVQACILLLIVWKFSGCC